jgi:hypothetical protein
MEKRQFTITHYLASDVNLHVDYNQLVSKIIVSFELETNRLLPLFRHKEEQLGIEINLFVASDEDYVACLNIQESLENKFVFDFNLWFFEDLSNDQFLRETITHELIHAFDIQVILENKFQYTASKNFMLSHRTNKIVQRSSQHDFSIQWAFLHFFATIRNEGVALMSEKILSKTQPDLNFEESIKLFSDDFNHALRLCNNSLFHKRISHDVVQSTLSFFEGQTGNYADSLLYHLTFKKDTEFSRIDYSEFIAMDRIEIERFSLIESLFSFDLSDFLRCLITDEAFGKLISTNDLFNLFSVFDRENYMAHQHLDLLHFAYNKNHVGFLDRLKLSVQIRLDFNELLDKHNAFLMASAPFDLIDDLKVLSNRMIALRNELNAEIVDLALTYLFQKEDIITDHSPFIGYQDDWIVLEGAYSLLINQAK